MAGSLPAVYHSQSLPNHLDADGISSRKALKPIVIDSTWVLLESDFSHIHHIVEHPDVDALMLPSARR